MPEIVAALQSQIEALPRTSIEMWRLCKTTLNVFLLDSYLEQSTFHFKTRTKIIASLRVHFLFLSLRLCQAQATCAQPQALGYTNRQAITKML